MNRKTDRKSFCLTDWLHIQHPKRWCCILAGAFSLLMFTARYDQQWTNYLHDHRFDAFCTTMGRTLFEGDLPGGSDLAILFMIGMFICYIQACCFPEIPRWKRWRPFLGFMVIAGLTTGVYIVHSLKWVIGRARPSVVAKYGIDYSEIFEFGPFFITDGTIYRGSIPSGHAAAVFLLMMMAYCLVIAYGHSSAKRLSGWIWGGTALLYALAMSVARSMEYSHWIGDGLTTIVINWMVMHGLFFGILRVPVQAELIEKAGRPIHVPPFWEIVFCFHLFWVVIGSMMVITGIRSAGIRDFPIEIVLILPGLWLIFHFIPRAYTTFTDAMAVFQEREMNNSLRKGI